MHADDIIPPVMFNALKHHAGALRRRIDELASEGTLAGVGQHLAALGSRLMDVYTGTLSPRDVCSWVIDELRRIGRFEPDANRDWLASQGDYATLTHPGDGTAWVVRLADGERYVHLHPGRWSPNTVRVRANVLKTAFVAVLASRVHGGDPGDRRFLDAVRRDHLGLPPLGRAQDEDAGLGAFLRLLRG